MGMDSSKYGGIERFNVELAKNLRAKGFKGVFVYEEEPANHAFVDDLEAAGGEIVVLNSRKSKLRFCKGFVKLIRKYHPILVHAHFTKARFYAIPIAYLMGVRKLFVTIHSTMVPKREIKPHTRLWCWWANKVSKVVAVSENIRTVYKENWPDAEVRRIYLGVKPIEGNREESRRKLGVVATETMLLTVSNFNHIKGLDVLCKAVKILKDKGMMDNARLYIVGQPDKDKEELTVLINELTIADCVRMEGISNEVPIYLSAADIYIQASRSEGIGMALMEAASASLPLVGTRVGGIPEIVRDGMNGLVVDSENPGMLADAIARLLQDEDLRKRLAANSLKVYQEDFSVASGVRQTVDYYRI